MFMLWLDVTWRVAPYRRGEKRAFQLALLYTEKLRPLADYGSSWKNSLLHLVLDAAQFFIWLYTIHDFKGDLDALRAHVCPDKRRSQKSAANLKCTLLPSSSVSESNGIEQKSSRFFLAYLIPWSWPMGANFLVECWYQWTKTQNRT